MRSRRAFSGRCCEKTTESEVKVTIGFERSCVPCVLLGLEHRSSEDPRDNAVGSRHILAVTVPKGFQHHSFFSGYPTKKQNPKTYNARQTCHPIWQQQRLSETPKPEC